MTINKISKVLLSWSKQLICISLTAYTDINCTIQHHRHNTVLKLACLYSSILYAGVNVTLINVITKINF